MSRWVGFFALVVSALLLMQSRLEAKEPRIMYEVNTGEGYFAEKLGKIVQLKSGQAACATASQYVVRDLKPGEQMCCTKTEAIVRTLGSAQVLVCSSLEAKVFDRSDESDSEHFPMYCGLASRFLHANVNLYKYEKLGCTATESMIVENNDAGWDVACNNNRCFKIRLNKGEKLLLFRFNDVP